MTEQNNQPAAPVPGPAPVAPQAEVEEYTVDVGAPKESPTPPPAEILPDEAPAAESKPNAHNHFSLSAGDYEPGLEVINLPSALDEDINEALNRTPNVELADSMSTRRWKEIVKDSTSFNVLGEGLVGALRAKGRDFRNHHEYNGKDLNARKATAKPMEGQILTGERAMIRVINKLNMGTVFQVELWHSGLHVTLKPPVETEIINLHNSLLADGIKFGRQSYGLIHSNYTAFVTDKLVKFAMDHIFETTAHPEKGVSIAAIPHHIVCQDIPILLWGLACSMYPRGFNYHRACVSNPETCNHIVEEKLNISKLIYTSMANLTDWQKNFMSSRQPNVKEAAELKRYREELVLTQSRRVTVNEGTSEEVSFVLRTPTVAEYLESGHIWINDIINNVERVMASDASQADREMQMDRHGNATMMRQYIHWVESIEERETPESQPNIINDRESIAKTLNVLSANDHARDFFMNEVTRYINESTVSLIGIPVYDCPACGKTQEGGKHYPEHTEVIPLDVIQVFFDLISQKLNKIQARE